MSGYDLTEIKQKIEAHFDRTELITFCQEMVRIPSHRDYPGQEAELGEFMKEWLEERGLKPWLQVAKEKRANVVCTVGEGNPELIFNGHIDTIPPYDMGDEALTGRIEGDWIIGRGAADMKGGAAAMAYALVVLNRTGLLLPGKLTFVGAVGEEYESLGTQHQIAEGLLADYAVVGEPTGMQVAAAHKAIEWIQINVTGRSIHSSMAHEGINACQIAAQIVTRIYEEMVPKWNDRTHHLAGASLGNVGRIVGGEQPNVVPAYCEIHMDRRWIPQEDLDEVYQEIRDLATEVVEGTGATAEVEPMPYSLRAKRVPLDTEPENPIVQASLAAINTIKGEDEVSEPIGVPYWGDAALLASAGIPTVNIGPGDISQAHSATEALQIDQLVDCAMTYALIPFALADQQT